MEIIGHRGSPDDAPENTLAAVRLAWERGADAVEVDVRLTRDGELVALHDGDTRRTTGVPGVPEHMTLRELRSLDAGRWKNLRFAGERIPTLEEVFATGGGRRFFIEIKRGPEVLLALRRTLEAAHLTARQAVIIAFDLATIRAAKQALPQFGSLWLRGYDGTVDRNHSIHIDAVIQTALDAGLDGLNLARTWPIDAAFVRKVKSAGLSFAVWTVDDPFMASQLLHAGVDGLTTNRCGPLRAELGLR